MLDTKSIEKLTDRELEQLRALTDPLRLKLFNQFREPRTVTEVASILGLERTSLYHHLQVLLKAGLIEEVETRKVRHLTESVYMRAVERVDFTRSRYDDPGPIEPYLQAIMVMSQDTDEDCRKSLTQNAKAKAASRRIIVKIKSEDLETTPKKISLLMHEFIDKVRELEDEDGDIDYSVTVTHFEM